MIEKKDKYEIPEWMGCFPFPPNEKKPFKVTKDMRVPFIYGFETTEIENNVHVSTDNLNIVEWILAPGSHIGPAARHLSGDECYYVLEGELTVCNPETGESFIIKTGEAILIPQETRHQGFNFTKERIVVLACMAPKIWTKETGSIIPDVESPRFLKGPEEPKYGKPSPIYSIPKVRRNIDALGSWPAPGPKMREEKLLIVVKPDDNLTLIHGKERHILFSFLVSSDYMHVAIVTVPVAATSEFEKHAGDEVVSVLEGELCIRIYNEGDGEQGETAFPHVKIEPGDSMLIPEGTSHQYINFTSDVVKAHVAIGPKN